ncbi:hypothetical protein AAZX31_01G086800 [Glycine max]
MDRKSHFIDRNCIHDFGECDFKFLNKSYRISNVAERELDFLDNYCEEQFPHINRDCRRSFHRGRHYDNPHSLIILNFYFFINDFKFGPISDCIHVVEFQHQYQAKMENSREFLVKCMK